MTSAQPGPDRPYDGPEARTTLPEHPAFEGDIPPPPPSAPPGEPPADDAATTPHDQPRDGSRHGRRTGKHKKLTFAQELPFLVLAALVLAIIIKAFVVQAFYIPSASMEQTLHGCDGCSGDRVMVNKLIYDFRGIHRGDIVVFNGKDNYFNQPTTTSSPSNPVLAGLRKVADWIGLAPEGTDYIKRVIGLPGDHVQCCDAKGRVMVNGVSLNESSYVYQDDHEPFNVVVPKGHVWVMGDHRSDSWDSRKVGAVPEDDIIGRTFAIIWPPSRMRWFGTPSDFHGIPTRTADAAPLLLSSAAVAGFTWVRKRRVRSSSRTRSAGSSR